MLIGEYADTAHAQCTFKTGFDVVWDVSHHLAEECVCSTVHCSMAAAKCTSDALSFARAICVTLDFHLNLGRTIR